MTMEAPDEARVKVREVPVEVFISRTKETIFVELGEATSIEMEVAVAKDLARRLLNAVSMLSERHPGCQGPTFGVGKVVESGGGRTDVADVSDTSSWWTC